MKIGCKTNSGYQLSLLKEAKQNKNPKRLGEMLTEVFCDSHITSEREEIHPEWVRLFNENKSRIERFIPSSEYGRMHEFLLKMSSIDPLVSEIDPQNSRISFLLGAGASKPKPSAIPTVKELLPDMLARARRLEREDVTELADFCEESEIENIEDLLTATQLATFCSRNPIVLNLVDYLLYRDHKRDEVGMYGKKRRDILSSAAFLQDTLQVLFGLLSSTMLPAKPNAAHKAIMKYAQEHRSSNIITTNYDCCIDLALYEKNLDFNYGLDFINRNPTNGNKKPGINLTKLHGSLNWFYCETCQDVQLINIKETVSDFLSDKRPYPVIAVCRICGGQRRPLLVPPLAMKFDIALPLTQLLDRATTAFESAEIIVVLGFSFAEADLYISRMLTKSMQRSKTQKLLIIDPDWGVVDKVQRKFAACIPDFELSRVLRICDDCTKTLPDFLEGKMIRKVEGEVLNPVGIASKTVEQKA